MAQNVFNNKLKLLFWNSSTTHWYQYQYKPSVLSWFPQLPSPTIHPILPLLAPTTTCCWISLSLISRLEHITLREKQISLKVTSQPNNVTILQSAPSYTAWWQRHIGVNNLPKVVTHLFPGKNRTHDLMIAKCSTAMPLHHLVIASYGDSSQCVGETTG